MSADDLRVFAFDHRAQFEEMEGATPARIGAFKRLCLRAATRVAAGRPGYGVLCDGRLGAAALAEAGEGLWIGRPVEWPGSRPLALEPEVGADAAGLAAWPAHHTVKCLFFAHPDDDAAMWADQLATLGRLESATRRSGLDLLLEVVPSRIGAVGEGTTAEVIRRVYAAGLRPDWWKLEAQASRAAWNACVAAIEANDPQIRGIVVLGLDAPRAELEASLRTAAAVPLVKGFAIGRTIFGAAARAWFAGGLTDEEAVARMAEHYRTLCRAWDAARRRTRTAA